MNPGPARGFAVDRHRLAGAIRRDNFRSGARRHVWVVRSVLKAAAIFCFVVSVFPAALDGELGWAITLSGRGLFRNLVIPILAAVALTSSHAWFLHRGAAAEPEVIAQRIEREWTQRSGPSRSRISRSSPLSRSCPLPA
jgi:hypothetical protein